MTSLRILLTCALLALSGFSTVSAAVPTLLNHQGRIAVGTTNFEGTGQFKFALVSGDGNTTYWSNDGTSTTGDQPTAFVSLTVVKGLYSVLLGDTALTNMTALPASVFSNGDVRLRVWFNDTTNGFQHLAPDQRLAAAPYALVASTVDQVLLSSVIAPPIKPVVAWGDNDVGQSFVPALANVAAIAASPTQSFALLDDGTVTPWGAGAALPGGLANVTHIAAGVNHALVRKSDGTVEGWGDDTHGKVSGLAGLTNAADVAAGDKHSLVLHDDGTITVLGFVFVDAPSVAPPVGLSSVKAIAAGDDHSLALKEDGTVVAWGRNDSGQATVPGGLTDVVAIAAGAFHSLAVKDDGTVVAWGWDLGGQSTVPPGLNGVVAVAGGYSFSMALKSDGTIVTWGDNSDGQTIVPDGTTQITAIAAGATHALALRADLIPAQVARLDQDNVFTQRVGIGRIATANALEVEGTAGKTTPGSWASNSDRRIKEEIQPVTGALEKLNQVRLVDYRYTDQYRAVHPTVADKRYLSVIAQEFAEVFPDHVKSSGEKLPDGSDILQVDTYPLTIYSAAAVQELHRENEALKKKLADQEERLLKLEAALNK